MTEKIRHILDIPSTSDVQEKMWIGIIQKMEILYAQLAQTTTEYEKKNQELLETKELTDTIMRSMVDAMIVLDSRGVIRVVNRATRELTGYREDDLIGQPMEIIFADPQRNNGLSFRGPRIQRLFREGSTLDTEINFTDKSGEQIPLSLNVSLMKDATDDITGVLIVARDLRQTKKLLAEAAAAEAHRAKAAELEKANRELRELQAQLIQAEKMASLGKLAAGVAHEINNPLGGIMMYSHLLLEDTPESDSRWENLGKITELAKRSKKIVKNLLDFARQSEPHAESHNINDILEGILTILEKQVLFHNITVIRKFQPHLPEVMVDAGEIQQVFMNMIINAAEAMEGHGKLTLETSSDQQKQWVICRIIDTGCGIAREHLSQLFEPFFTTKEPGKGTGLGLSICYGIIRRHKGKIEVESEPGRGTVFTIYFPLEDA